MPRRDYMARSKKKSGVSKSTILSIVVVLLLAMGAGLWLLKENAPAPTIPVSAEAAKPVPNGTNLPSRPEEVYSYIRDLETREVVTNPTKKTQEKLAQLSPEQLKQLEEKRKQEELARLAVEQASVEKAQVQTETVASTEKTIVQPSEAELAAQKAQEQKLAEEKRKLEEKRKQAELRKQQELAQKKAEQNKVVATTATPAEVEQTKTEKAKLDKAKTEQPKAEQVSQQTQVKTETVKKEQPKIVASAAKPNEKAANQSGRFGLQCGAFKNKAQAENMQARLAMAGFNARIATNAEWNRVFVGPIGDRAATSNAQSNARSVAECVIVSM